MSNKSQDIKSEFSLDLEEIHLPSIKCISAKPDLSHPILTKKPDIKRFSIQELPLSPPDHESVDLSHT